MDNTLRAAMNLQGRGLEPYVNHRPPNAPGPQPVQSLRGIGYTPTPTSTAVATRPYQPNFTMGGRPPAAPPKMPPVSNPNVGVGGSAEAKAFQASRAAPSAPVTPTVAPAAPTRAPGLRGALGRGVSNAAGAAKFVGKAAGAAAVLPNFNDFKINDPEVDSSAGGTFNALRDGNFSAAGRSLSKGMLETGMDLGSFAADTADIFVPGQPFSEGYGNMLRGQFGDQLVDNRTSSAPQDEQPPTRSATTQAGRAAQAGSVNVAPQASKPNDIRRIDTGSTPLFTNVQGNDNDVLMARGPISDQNMAAGDALGARYASLRNAGNEETQAQPSGPQASTMPDTGGFGLLDKNARRERSLRMDAQQLMPGSRKAYTSFLDEQNVAPRKAAERELEAQVEGVKNDTLRRGQDMEYASSSMKAQASRAGSLRDQANADRTFAAGRADAAFNQEATRQTMLDKATEGVRKETEVYDAEGKLDPAKSQAKFDVMRQLFPGVTDTDPATRNAAMSDSKAMMAIFDKAAKQDKVGWDVLRFWEPKAPALRGMPSAQGSTTETLSGMGGFTTLGTSNGDTILTKNGRKVNLGRLDEQQLELLDRAKKQGWGK